MGLGLVGEGAGGRGMIGGSTIKCTRLQSHDSPICHDPRHQSPLDPTFGDIGDGVDGPAHFPGNVRPTQNANLEHHRADTI